MCVFWLGFVIIYLDFCQKSKLTVSGKAVL
jgi:hypothetical protein